MGMGLGTRLVPWQIPDTTSHLVFVRDSCIPKGVKAFFKIDYRRGRDVVKIRVTDKDRILHAFERQRINQLMHEIAAKFEYSFERLLEYARRDRQY